MARIDFEELVERLPLVVYVDKLDDKSSPLYISPQIAQLMGYSQEEWLADPDLFTGSLHPDDRERVQAYLIERNAGLSGSTTMFLDYRLIARDGRVVWVRDDEVVVLDEDGDPRCTGLHAGRDRAPHDSSGSSCSSASSRSPRTRRRPTRSSPLQPRTSRRCSATSRSPTSSPARRVATGSATRPTRAGRSSGTRPSGRPSTSNASAEGRSSSTTSRRKPGSTQCASAFSSAASPPRWTCRSCATARWRAFSGSTAPGRESGATTKSPCSSTSRGSSRSCSRTRRPASSGGVSSATSVTATHPRCDQQLGRALSRPAELRRGGRRADARAR